MDLYPFFDIYLGKPTARLLCKRTGSFSSFSNFGRFRFTMSNFLAISENKAYTIFMVKCLFSDNCCPYRKNHTNLHRARCMWKIYAYLHEEWVYTFCFCRRYSTSFRWKKPKPNLIAAFSSVSTVTFLAIVSIILQFEWTCITNAIRLYLRFLSLSSFIASKTRINRFKSEKVERRQKNCFVYWKNIRQNISKTLWHGREHFSAFLESLFPNTYTC